MKAEAYIKESTEDLVQYVKWHEDPEYKEASKYALEALYERFGRVVTEKCEIIASKKGLSSSDALEIVENVFKSFYKYCKFKPEQHEDCDKGLKYYLYTIAYNETINLWRKRNGIGVSPYTGYEEVIEELPSSDSYENVGSISRKQLEREREIIQIGLDRHSVKHQIIYLTYLFHQKKGHKMPPHLLDNLRKKVGLPQPTIHAYLKEVKDTVKDYLIIYGKQKK
ncbi:MAG: hypothetical protein OQJ96_06120 [Flavobacteriales bacterium]|nr:hypothetical protein [Flavobacteriales bacterium]MCW8937654.1 hypothetical protein [Flavobacteriales bacterium]MCW8967584.1 hypothetical protein [Flavobacteriales bacterium]MCW8990142.1 hypothetical protein [Flavobacteriales bacterium]MCW9019860.1 hypothetical protein [Flavobacteriales bacterium]